MPKISQVELEILKDSFRKLVSSQYLVTENTRLLRTRTGISIHGCHASHSKLSDSMIQESLSSFEIDRLSRFNEQARREQYLIGRILAKRSISDLINIDLTDFRNISISNDISGNLVCNLSIEKIDFNGEFSISHKRKYVVAACTTCGEIGLDLEELTKHYGIERRISRNHTEEDIRRFTSFLETAYPDLDLEFSYTVIWSALEAGFKAFSSINTKSPLEFKVITKDDKVSIIHLSEVLVSKSVYMISAGRYLLTIVS